MDEKALVYIVSTLKCSFYFSFNSAENSNLNEDSLDINIQSSQGIEDSLTGFSQSLIQAATAVGQQNVTSSDAVSKPAAQKRILGPVTEQHEVRSKGL